MDYYVLYLDRYHLGDPLFLQSLARGLARAGQAAPRSLVVHGSGEPAERMLEGEGYVVEREAGVLQVRTPEEAALVERAMRVVNRQVVGILTDAVVSAVGMTGADRRLMTLAADGTLAVTRIAWVETLMQQRVVPVVAALVRAAAGERIGEVRADAAAVALARALGVAQTTVVCFTKTSLPGLMEGRAPRPEVAAGALPDADVVSEPEGVRRMVAAGVRVLLTNTSRFADKAGPVGTYVVE